MASYIRVNLDTSKENYLIEKCIQGDDLRLEAYIFENGVKKDLANHGITINVIKPDGTYTNDVAAGATEVSGNKITKQLSEQATTAYGMAKVSVTLVDNQKLQNSTFEFKLLIKKFTTEGAIPSGSEIPVIKELTQKVAEAGQVKAETEQLIATGQAVPRSELNNYATKVELKATDDKLTQDIPKFNQEGLVFGQEYLAPFHSQVKAWSFPTWVDPNTQVKVIFSGDSTTEQKAGGVGGLDTYLKQFSEADGLYMINAICKGHSGQNTKHWADTFVDQDMAENPALYIVRWGINDPYYSKANNTMLAQQNTPNPTIDAQRRTAEDFNNSLRAGLTKIRAQKNYTQLPIVLMTPSSTNDDANKVSYEWYESIVPYIRQAARDFQCVFIDTYQFLYDSTNASDTMDAPFNDNRHIHPNEMRNAWIVGLLYETILPKSIINQCTINRITQAKSGQQLRSSTELPSAYPFGISMYRTKTPNTDFPIDGEVITIKAMDGATMQFNNPYLARDKGFNIRFGNQSNDQWTVWQRFDTGFTNTPITPSTGWTMFTGYTAIECNKDNHNGIVYLNGLIKDDVGTANELMFTLPQGYRPLLVNRWFPVATGTGYGLVCVQTDGKVLLKSGGRTFVSLDGISFRTT